ncbi:MAG TPA: hypothetical protein VF824_07950 [Thermoanaerobaculia bacterium]|jgi:hypothetical protein
MNHLSQEDLVLCFYDEPEAAGAREHLAQCADCRDELARLAAVLSSTDAFDAPEPEAGYESIVWNRLRWRLRAEEKRRPMWATWSAVAAAVLMAFLGGVLWKTSRRTEPAPQIAQQKPAAAVQPVAQTQPAPTQQVRDRILFVVVSDHFEQSERMLVELTNLAPGEGTDIRNEREHAEALLASNRLYRRTASERGEDSVATVLDELEPVLLQIAHTPDEVSASELRAIQKRVEAKGLVFKLRVLRSGVRDAQPKNPQQPSI